MTPFQRWLHTLSSFSLSLTPALFLPTNITIYFYIIDSDPGAGIGLVVIHISLFSSLYFLYYSISLPIYQSLSLSVNLSIKNLLPQTHGLLSVLFYLPLLHYFSYICANCVDIKLLIVFFAADSIRLQYKNHHDQWIDVSLLRTDIAWDADKKFKFKNPALGGRKLKDGDLLFLHLINFLLYKSILISWSFSKWRKIFL